MKYKTVPEYQIVRTERGIRVARQVTLQVTRHSRWYCPLCDVGYDQNNGLRQRCDNCGTLLEEY